MRIRTNFYDNVQLQAFRRYPNIADISNLVINGAVVSKDEFLSYMMFTEQMNLKGFQTYEELCARVSSRLGDIHDFLSFENDSVQARIVGSKMMQPGFTERLGVALGLCVINSLHGLTMADWKKIPEEAVTTFDFEISIASTGNIFVQVENKGSVVENNDKKASTISKHKANILEKKFNARQKAHGNPVLYYGTIGVLDNRPASTAKVLLVDPPISNTNMDPLKTKLLKRLNYYLQEFKHVGLRNEITAALQTRISQIQSHDNWRNFDKVALPIRSNANYLQNPQSVLINKNAGYGKVFSSKNAKSTIIVAFDREIIRAIIQQNFEKICNYSYKVVPEKMKAADVTMRFGAESSSVPEQYRKLAFKSSRAWRVTLRAAILCSSDGRFFAALPAE